MTIEYPSLTDRIYQHIKESILTNSFQPGERLQEQELADRLSVSRTPVREAINRLGAEGLVTVVPRRGVFVTKPNTKDITDIYEVREALEVLSIELVIPKITEEDIQVLQKIMGDFLNAYEQQQFDRCFELDRAFHDHIIHLTGNQKLEDFNQQMGAFVSVTRLMHCDDDGLQTLTYQEHMDILLALANRDREDAVHSLRKHIRRVKNDLVVKYENNQLEVSAEEA
jgi:DNA-binding GntR family transcriptional regulator